MKRIKKYLNLRHVVCCLIMLFGFTVLTAQENPGDTKALINDLALEMFEDTVNKNFEAIINRTHPKVFEFAPKEMMISLFESMFNGGEGFKIDIPNEIPAYKISDIYEGKEGNLTFAFVSYDMKMNMTFIDESFDDEGKEMMVAMMNSQGLDVEFISDNTMKVLQKDQITVFLKEEATNNKWVLINYDTSSPIYSKVLSAELIEQAEAYKQSLTFQSKKKSKN